MQKLNSLKVLFGHILLILLEILLAELLQKYFDYFIPIIQRADIIELGQQAVFYQLVKSYH